MLKENQEVRAITDLWELFQIELSRLAKSRYSLVYDLALA